ncbi:MAG TPA: GPW/gp25 family protein [Chloroflexota bacterium]
MSDDQKAFLGQGWSFPLAFTADGEIQMAVHEEDVRQAIRIILSTGFGERVMRPDFGAGLRAVLFEPLSTTTMSLVQHHVERALIEWEPRIDLLEVTVEADNTTVGRMLINLQYRVRATNAFYNLVYPFYLLEGAPT